MAQHVTLVLIHDILRNKRTIPGLALGVDVRMDDLHLQQKLADHQRSRDVQINPLVHLEVVQSDIGHHPDGDEVHREVNDQARRQGIHQRCIVAANGEGRVVHHVTVQVIQIVLIVRQQMEQTALIPGKDRHRDYGDNTLHLSSEQLLEEANRGDDDIQEDHAIKQIKLRHSGLVHLNEVFLDRGACHTLASYVRSLLIILPQGVNIVMLRITVSHEVHQARRIHVHGFPTLTKKVQTTHNKWVQDAVACQIRSLGSQMHFTQVLGR